MIMKLCRRCKKPIMHPLSYCPKCQEIYNKNQLELQRKRDKKYNEKRDPKYKRFYNSKEWIILKEKKLQDTQYTCERCKKLAVEVHHIKPIQTDDGWEERLNYFNLESLCIDCHNYRHKRFQRRRR